MDLEHRETPFTDTALPPVSTPLPATDSVSPDAPINPGNTVKQVTTQLLKAN